MIKATAYGQDGTPILILGLSGENMTRLMAKEPILIRAADMVAMGLPSGKVLDMAKLLEAEQLRGVWKAQPGPRPTRRRRAADRTEATT